MIRPIFYVFIKFINYTDNLVVSVMLNKYLTNLVPCEYALYHGNWR